MSFLNHNKNVVDDMEGGESEDDEAMNETEREFDDTEETSQASSSSLHPKPLQMDPTLALHLTRTRSMFVLLDIPQGLQVGFDYWSMTVGREFRGMKMIPSGVHYLWTAQGPHTVAPDGNSNSHRLEPMMNADLAPRLGQFIWLNDGDTFIRRWDPASESLIALSVDEEERYIAGARRFDFDKGQVPYPLNETKKWTSLSSHITRDLMQKLEPADKMIGMYAANKYSLEDKKRKPQSDSVNNDECMQLDNPREKKLLIVDEDVIHDDAATTSKQTPSRRSFPSDSVTSSTSFYTRIPTIAAFLAREEKSAPVNCNLSSEEQELLNQKRAQRRSQLHMDQSDLLEHVLSDLFHSHEDDFLGEMQFGFVAFLIGQDLGGFNAWKSLIILISRCGDAFTQRHALVEKWLQVLADELVLVPKDFFLDELSQDNFLLPAINEFFAQLSEANVPTSLIYAAKELREMMKTRFLWKLKQVPNLVHKDEIVDATGRNSFVNSDGSNQQQQHSQPASQRLTMQEQEAQLRAFKLQLLQQAEDDEFAPTVADE